MAELFSIVIGGAIFLLAWNCRALLKNGALTLLGVSSLAVAALDLVHTLAYKGMPIFPGSDANLPTQLWIAARFVQSLSLLAAPLLLNRTLRPDLLLAGYSAAVAVLLLSIFTWNIFPVCFVEGAGQTAFKRGSEFAICGILVGALSLFFKNRNALDEQVFRWLAGALVLSIASELAFTFYVDVYGASNIAGHCLKFVAFYFIYRAIIDTGVSRPYALLLRETKQSETRYRLMFDRNPDGVFALDSAGHFIVANPACVGISGFALPELLQKKLGELCAPDQVVQTTREVERCFRDPGYAQFETALLRKDGSRVELWIAVEAVVENGNAVALYCTAKNITERKRAEADLKEARDQLERANTQLEATVAERTARLRDSIAELEQFSYALVHDMRAPLRSMQSFASILCDLCTDCPSDKEAERREYMQRICNSSRRMDALIVDALNYSRIAHHECALAEVDLDVLLRGILESYPNLQPPAVEVHVEKGLATVLGNEAALTQCFSNLLGNAVKFGTPGVTPRVRVWSERVEDFVRVWVEDNGIGIATEHQDRIWGMFERLQSRIEGTGIGLAIVRKVVDRMGGRVGLESEPGKGSRFWVDLKPAPTTWPATTRAFS